MDLAYVIAAIVVPAATVIGLWVWFARSQARASARTAVDLDNSELAQSVAAVRRQLLELSGQMETLSRGWEERDRRLTDQLNALLALTERPRRIDLSVADRTGKQDRSGRDRPDRSGRPGTRRSPRP